MGARSGVYGLVTCLSDVIARIQHSYGANSVTDVCPVGLKQAGLIWAARFVLNRLKRLWPTATAFETY